MSKKNILKGTLILTVAGLATKLLGFYNRIFLTRLIGVKEIGVYQLIFPLYMLAFSLSCQGISITLTKQIAYYFGSKKTKNAKQVFILGTAIACTISIFLAFIIYSFSNTISYYILKNIECAPLLKILSIAIPFVSVKACINAFFVGVDRPVFQGISHFIEQIFRIGITYVLSLLWSTDRLNAKAAVIAVVFGEIAATILALFCYSLTRKDYFGKSENNIRNISEKNDRKEIITLFVKDSVPITINNVLLTLFSSLEAIILPSVLYSYYLNGEKALEIFGMITGIVIPFLLFPATITTSLSTMLLPAVSYAKAKKDDKTISQVLRNSMFFCITLGVFSWIFYNLCGEFVCQFTFNNKIAGSLLAKMGFLCPLIYIAGNLSAILNGIGKTFNNLIYHVISIIIRIMFTVLLVPNYGVTAYVAGMTISYVILDILMVFSVKPDKNYSS